jgi:hypothetical protein
MVMCRFGSDWHAVVEQANAAREAKLLNSQYRFKDMTVNIPFIAQLLPLSERVELARIFKPVLYHPRNVICSAAHFADRVIIVVEGEVKFQNGQIWEIGEAAGFTCLVPHRWAQSAVSTTSSKLIELPREQYIAFLRRHGIFERVKTCVLALMFPSAASGSDLHWALNSTQKLKNPPMYPLSASPVVDPCEPHFGIKVVTFGRTPIHRRLAQTGESAVASFVNCSMANIDDRVRRRQKVRPTSALPAAEGRDKATWSRGKLLIMRRQGMCDERAEMSSANHPVLKELQEKRRKPLSFARPSHVSE